MVLTTHVTHTITKYTVCRFDLAVQLGDLDVASEIAEQLDTENKWRQLVSADSNDVNDHSQPPIASYTNQAVLS